MRLFKKRKVGALLAGATLAITSLAATAAPANAADLNCSSGTYNQRFYTSGACAWGNVTKSGLNVQIAMVVVDTLNNNHGAYLHYRLCSGSSGNCDPYVTAASTNGYDTSAPVVTTVTLWNSTAFMQMRVCNGSVSCTSWKTVP